MEFLPIRVNGDKVYAGFLRRFGSMLIDFIILLIINYSLYFFDSISFSLTILISVFSVIFFSIYTIYFHYKYGATLGKIVFGIKVTLPNGEAIRLKQAVLRSSVDIFFSILFLMATVNAMNGIDYEHYVTLAWEERNTYTLLLLPAWYIMVSSFEQVWIWSELLVLLFNKRKRAIHDFIAGTVVIKKEYAIEPDTRGILASN